MVVVTHVSHLFSRVDKSPAAQKKKKCASPSIIIVT